MIVYILKVISLLQLVHLDAQWLTLKLLLVINII